MADLKISQLTGATTPLAGTEVLPIVQSGSTVKVSVANLTAGRDVAMAGGTSTDHYKVAAGKGLAWSGNTASYMTPEDNAQGARIAAGGSFLLSVNAGSTVLQVDATTKDATFNLGNIVIGTSGKGIDFSATPGTGTSELLADYEEGTWTPVDSSGAGLTFSGASGTYTKIGRQVTVNGQLTFPATASVADIAIGGLPFTVGTFSVGAVNNADVVFTITSSTVFYIYDVAGVRKTNVNYSGVTIYFTIAYFV
jgi:hypothetical protein